MIASFSGEHRFLSNFHPAPVTAWGILFPTVEHAYQAAKIRPDCDAERLRTLVSRLATPGDAKRYGRKIALRSDWSSFRLTAMKTLLDRKFAIVPLAKQLKATDPQELVEGNSWNDTFWGVCNGRGENHLGRLLMQVRSTL